MLQSNRTVMAFQVIPFQVSFVSNIFMFQNCTFHLSNVSSFNIIPVFSQANLNVALRRYLSASLDAKSIIIAQLEIPIYQLSAISTQYLEHRKTIVCL